MKLLALDTSTVACTVALDVDGELGVRHAERPREHTKLLMPMIRELLTERGLAPAELDAIVLGNGPGSFIGLRIAAAVAQGLAFGAGCQLVPVSSLAAVAAAAMREGDVRRVAVAQDAHMNEVYLGCYEAAADGLPEALGKLELQSAAKAPEQLPAGCIAAGEGWHRYPEFFELAAPLLAGRSTLKYPRAADVLVLGKRQFAAQGGIAPGELEPAYIRERVASVPAR